MLRKKKPTVSKNLFIAAKCAQTLDGKIATFTGDSKWITSAKARTYARKIRRRFDAILIGSQTVLADNPSLDPFPKSKHFTKIILDSQLRILESAKLLKGSAAKQVLIVTTRKASVRKKERLAKKGVRFLVYPGQSKIIPWRWLYKSFQKQGFRRLLIEGGASVVSSALCAKVVDYMYVYIAPKILGDQRARSGVEGFRVKKIKDVIKLKNVQHKVLGEDLLITGDI